MMNIAHFANTYSLMIYLLLAEVKLKKETIFILENIDIKLPYRTIKVKNKIKNRINIYLYELFLNLCIKILILLKGKNISIYGQDHTLIGNKLLEVGNFYLIEDGSMSYSFFKNPKKNILKKKINCFMKRKAYLGVDSSVKKIYLTGLAPIPEEISYKVELINLKELWSKKTLEEQNDILDIFSFDLNIKEKIKGRDIILFTQPLSEDNVITEEEKLKIYSEIIKKYPKDKLVIKTHPREKTDYKDVFKEYLVLDNPFPFEILNLLDVKFNKAITLFSTAALGLGEGVEVDFYGTEVHVKILERFGSCDNIMKRNCFLKEE